MPPTPTSNALPPKMHSLKDNPLKKSSLKAATSGLIVFVISTLAASRDRVIFAYEVWLAASTSLFLYLLQTKCFLHDTI